MGCGWLRPGCWTTLFGSQFGIAGQYGLPYLLGLYAAATSLYALSVVIIAYEMAYKIANTSWVQLAFSGVLIAGICFFHSSLEQVIRVQLGMMAFLLAIVAMPFLLRLSSRSEIAIVPEVSEEVRMLRRVSEDEVIAEFLKNDFNNPEFREYQQAFAEMVTAPNLNRADENKLRRTLLFIRHGALWRELPPGRNGLKWKSAAGTSSEFVYSREPSGESWPGEILP